MRIAVVIPTLTGGGAERIAALLAAGWAHRGHKVVLVTWDSERQGEYPLDPAVTRVALGLPLSQGNPVAGLIENWRRVRALRGVLRSTQADVALGHITGPAVVTTLAATGLRTHAIACEHSHPPATPVAGYWHWLRKRTYPHATRVVMLTQQSLEWLEENIPRTRGTVMPNPVMFPLPVHGRLLAPEQIVANDRPVILTVGRMVHQKHLELAIDAFAKIAARHASATLVIVGEGPDRPQLEEKVRKLGLESRILMPGWAGNLADWYRRADLLMMSSRFEGFPNVLLEAMSHGCPAVSVDCPTGPRDIIDHGRNGWLVPMGDDAANGLAQAALKLLEDPGLRAQMSSIALAAREQYALDVILDRWQALFDAIGIHDDRVNR